jgi:hypothetical protein
MVGEWQVCGMTGSMSLGRRFQECFKLEELKFVLDSYLHAWLPSGSAQCTKLED